MNFCNFSLLLLSILLLLTFFNHTKAATQISYPPPPYFNCSTNSTYAPNSTYHANLQTLLSWLSSNATATAQIYSTTVAEGNTTTSSSSNSNNIYGLFMCRIGDGEPNCKDCVINSTVLITKLCPSAKEAMLWAKNCFVRYSDRYFFTTVEDSPKRTFMNGQDYVGQVGRFNSILWNTMNDVRNLTAGTPVGSMKYGYKSENITANQTLYAIGWCIPYLSSENCSWCLSNAIAEITAICCKGKIGGRVIYPSCGIRYEMYSFYQTLTSETLPQVPNTPAPPRPLAPSGKGKQSVLLLVIVLVVPVVVSVVLLSLISCSFFLSSRKRKNHETVLKESFGNEVAIMESLWFDLGEIESATNKFAKENMIGKGGFGEVYKGVISNGEEIAVKRLLGSSRQGEIEFKNEVLVIAQLQHKNLVELRGFCLDGQEKILIYEYVHNKSLDYFLFDSQKRRQLNWSVRHNIIKGIARGILYLHEDSRLKIIHRDLKPSNVLLDSNMNPKISDFGIAKIVDGDNMEENTHRIMGTYGYMSPEYAMHGQFSVKSDVYSFGVMLLEIMSGKRKGSRSVSDSVDDIRKYALTKWRERMPLGLLDSKLEGSYSENEVIRCIHIGLLCVEEAPSDRPRMAEVVSFLNNPSVDLPMPTEQNIKKENILGRIGLDSSSGSNNESVSLMTMSQCYLDSKG